MPRAISTIDPVDTYVGQRLRAERLRLKLTQGELGSALGVTFQQIQKYERGSNRVSASMLVKAANFMGVTVADLFPAPNAELSAERTDILAIRGGGALVEYFTVMKPSQRVVLLQVAQEFARMAD